MQSVAPHVEKLIGRRAVVILPVYCGCLAGCFLFAIVLHIGGAQTGGGGRASFAGRLELLIETFNHCTFGALYPSDRLGQLIAMLVGACGSLVLVFALLVVFVSSLQPSGTSRDALLTAARPLCAACARTYGAFLAFVLVLAVLLSATGGLSVDTMSVADLQSKSQDNGLWTVTLVLVLALVLMLALMLVLEQPLVLPLVLTLSPCPCCSISIIHGAYSTAWRTARSILP